MRRGLEKTFNLCDYSTYASWQGLLYMHMEVHAVWNDTLPFALPTKRH